jgi:hypothetical protein
MMVYVVLEYHKGTAGNIWADPHVFTSRTQRDDYYHQMDPNKDFDRFDVEVKKRAYSKPNEEAQVETELGEVLGR